MQHIPSTFLSGVTFKLAGDRIKSLAIAKMEALKDKIVMREARIAKLREEYKITDADLIDLLRQAQRESQRGVSAMSYRIASTMALNDDDTVDASPQQQDRFIPAGVVAAMDAERHAIDEEEAAVKRLRTITDNMDPNEKFQVSLSDLEFLGL